ncbi:MAG: methylaspartate mutase, partial [SAR324 cluster bacterium]|nr:methylaspartate mutase [SAR324 cluster bacterium]
NREGAPVFNRTVSANLGMSYSIANVLLEAGPKAIGKWLPFELSESELKDRLRNKMIRPTTIPQTLEDLWLEQAVCREALRLSLAHHRLLAVGLSGTQQKRGIADLFVQARNRYELVDLQKLDLVIGSGGVLSHAPNRMSAALMMLDGFALEGVTQLAVDSIFMMPHLGVLASVNEKASTEIFLKDCLINLGHAVVASFSGSLRQRELGKVFCDGKLIGSIERGRLKHVEMETGITVSLHVEPSGASINVGAGAGKPYSGQVKVGHCGLFLDGRNRPIEFPKSDTERILIIKDLYKHLGLMEI